MTEVIPHVGAAAAGDRYPLRTAIRPTSARSAASRATRSSTRRRPRLTRARRQRPVLREPPRHDAAPQRREPPAQRRSRSRSATGGVIDRAAIHLMLANYWAPSSVNHDRNTPAMKSGCSNAVESGGAAGQATVRDANRDHGGMAALLLRHGGHGRDREPEAAHAQARRLNAPRARLRRTAPVTSNILRTTTC